MFARIACLTRYLMIVTVVLCASVGHSQKPPADGANLTPEMVQGSINRAVGYLLSNQQDDGGWSEHRDYPGGVTSLVTLALINAGLPPDHPKVARALQYLRQKSSEKTYSVSLQTMAFCAADPRKFAVELQRNVEWLINAQLPGGGWSYGSDRNSGEGDPSNSQFALLALHEAQRARVEVSAENWKKVFDKARANWVGIQNKNGSFPYFPGGTDSRGSMTCAGIASLVIVGSQMGTGEASVGQSIRCCGEDRSNNREINQALQWLGDHFAVDRNPNFNDFHLYYLYGLERAGRMTGQRFIGKHDWYREGANQLLKMQTEVEGQYKSNSTNFGNAFTETAFGLLFLAKGKRQIVVSRLKFGPGEDWNHHSLAVQHLTAHTEQVWKRELAWQTIDIEVASLSDLLESPVLFISGSSIPQFSSEHRRMLREYVEQQGGFIFAEACDQDGCNGKEFDDYMRKFAVDVLGKPLEKLPPDHPIWHAERSVDLKAMPEDFWLYGVQSCCRLGMVYCPISLSCRWQLNLPFGVQPTYPAAIKAELDNSTLAGINVLSYATGKELKQKLQSVLVLDEIKSDAPTDRGVFVLPQLQHNAGADDAPRAISNLVDWLGKENKFRMSSEHLMLPITADAMQKYPVVFMHGRGELRLSEPQRAALRTYLKNGGFLFADAICADEQFSSTFRREMEVVLGSELQALPNNHELLQNTFSGFDVRQVSVIEPQRNQEQIAANQRKISPILEVATVDDRIAVVFSPLDLSCALESRHSLQCRGYLREDAARIGMNVILFGLQQ
jgi:hypothetical protein